jgi:outer membrane immunogenic protein
MRILCEPAARVRAAYSRELPMRNMRTFAGAALLGFGVSATTAIAQPILGPGPWSGFYLGGHFGGAFSPNNLDFADLSTAQDLAFQSHTHGDSFLGGVQAGYNWQTGNLLIGIEGDASFGKNINYLSTARGRVGVPMGSFLVYGTAGAAFEGAHEQFRVFQGDFPGIFDFHRDVNKTGWTAGGGVETFVMPAVSVGIDGLYYGLGRDTNVLTTDAGGASEPFAVRDDRNFAVVRARLTYHFGW